jgi:hypothetical protein
MTSPISKFIFKLDNSPVMSRHRKKHVVLKNKGPHIGLYVKTNNNHKWVCWTSKFERHLLNDLGVKTPRKRRYKLN